MPPSELYKILSLKSGAVLVTTAITFWLPTSQTDAVTIAKDSRQEIQSEQSPFLLSGRLGPGYLSGEAHEYVYWPEEGGRTASELVWDISSVTMFGIGASVRPLNRLNINADFWFNLGEGGGHLIDYDWLEQGKDWTHRSIHENTDVTKAQIYDINMEVTMFSSGTVTCIGIAGYRHDIFEWEARGGSYIYSDNGFRNSSGTFPPNVHGITYEQSFNAPYLGIGVKGDFDSFQITARVTGSTFAGGKATDQHFRHYLITHDNFSRENTWWALAFGFTYPINKAMAIRASYSYERYDTMKGDTEWHYYDFEERENYTDAAGADLKTSLLFLELSYRF